MRSTTPAQQRRVDQGELFGLTYRAGGSSFDPVPLLGLRHVVDASDWSVADRRPKLDGPHTTVTLRSPLDRALRFAPFRRSSRRCGAAPTTLYSQRLNRKQTRPSTAPTLLHQLEARLHEHWRSLDPARSNMERVAGSQAPELEQDCCAC